MELNKFATEESQRKYRGYNPAFYNRVMKKRAEAARREKARQVVKSNTAEKARRRAELTQIRAMAEARSDAERQQIEQECAGPIGLKVNQELINEILANKTEYQITQTEIMRRICGALGVSRSEILSDKRSKHIGFARHAIMYWTRRLTQRSLPDIGHMMGGRDHSTIHHGYRIYPEKRAKMGRTVRALK